MLQSKYKEAAVVCKQAIKIRELLGTQNPSFVKTLILAANIQKDRVRLGGMKSTFVGNVAG